ncbi:SIP domain-containing protein [Flexivirga sp. B27]
MNRHRRGPSTHVLIAGDEQDLPVIRELAAALPRDAYGQILVETPIQAGPPELSVPERVAVQWLPRAVGSVQPGHRLAESLAAWAHEWLPEGDRHLHRCHHLFVGAVGSCAVEVVREVLIADACPHLESLAHITVTATSAPGVTG